MVHTDNSNKKRLDTAIVILLCLLVLVMFWRVPAEGLSISKINVIGEWDSVFDKLRTGQSQAMDPSLILLMVPYYMLVGRSWHRHELPLWNASSGFGAPLLADPQSLSLSPLHVPLAFAPDLHVYNLILLIELMLMSTGAYLLGRSVGLSCLCSTFCALTLLLCPWEQWYLELIGNGYSLIPFLFFFFIRAGRQQSLASAGAAGAACAVFLLSAHPELSLCSILSASAVLIFIVPSLKAGIRLVAIAAAVAFSLSAPMLLPFIEYLKNSDSYKFGNSAPAYIPWQTLAFNLIQPGFGMASPFLGVLATIALSSVPFILARIFLKRSAASHFHQRLLMALFLLSVAAVAIASKFGPLAQILTQRPFSYLVVNYVFPILLVVVTLLAGFGLQSLFVLAGIITPAHNETPQSSQPAHITNSYTPASPLAPGRHLEWYAAGGVVLLIVLFPYIVEACHIDLRMANFDMTLPAMALRKTDGLRNAALAGLVFLALRAARPLQRLLSGRKFESFVPPVLGIACLAFGAVSEQAVSRKSLPIHALFNYPKTETIAKLEELGGRYIAIGDHTLRPNTNLAYGGLRDARFHNPMFPDRYLDFMNHAGAKLDEFNQVFSVNLSPMLNMAGIKYVVSGDALPAGPSNGTQSSIQAEETPDNNRLEFLIRTSDGLNIYKNRQALPEAFVVHKTIKVEREDQALERISEPSFDPRVEVVLEDRAAPEFSRPATAGEAGVTVEQRETRSIHMQRLSDLTVLMDVTMEMPGMLVLSDIWYPGWDATVDGAPSTIYRANYLFRALRLQKGHHSIRFHYWPFSFMLGASFTLMLGLSGVLFLVKPPKKRVRTKHDLITHSSNGSTRMDDPE